MTFRNISDIEGAYGALYDLWQECRTDLQEIVSDPDSYDSEYSDSDSEIYEPEFDGEHAFTMEGGIDIQDEGVVVQLGDLEVEYRGAAMQFADDIDEGIFIPDDINIDAEKYARHHPIPEYYQCMYTRVN